MKEELQSKLVEILSSMQSVAGKAGDFAMEQLPDIAQQYVAYGRAWSLVDLACAVAVALAGLFAARWGYRVDKEDPYVSPAPIFMQIIGGLMAFLGGVGVMVSAKAVVLVWFAPKVWLLKEIASLVK